MKLKVVLHKEEDGGYSVEVPALHGCYTQGDSIEQVRERVLEAMIGWLEVANESYELAEGDEIIEVEV